MAPRKKAAPKKKKAPKKKAAPKKETTPQKTPPPDLGKTKWQDLLETPDQDRALLALMYKHEPLKREQKRTFACIGHTLADPQSNPPINFPPPRLFPTKGRTWEEYERDPYQIELKKSEASQSGSMSTATMDNQGSPSTLSPNSSHTLPSFTRTKTAAHGETTRDLILPHGANGMTVDEINVINILTNLSAMKKHENQEQIECTQPITTRKFYKCVPTFQDELEILNSILNNQFSDPELHQLFSRNCLIRKTIAFYSEWIATAREERMAPKGRLQGLPSSEMAKKDQGIVRWIYYVLHRATNGKTYWDHSGTLKVRWQKGRRVSTDSNATNPTSETQDSEGKDVRWCLGRSWYEYLSTNDLHKQQTRDETIAQVLFWRNLVEKYSDLSAPGPEEDLEMKDQRGEETESEDEPELLVHPSNFQRSTPTLRPNPSAFELGMTPQPRGFSSIREGKRKTRV